jgi:ketosteroid isomerase-like protein
MNNEIETKEITLIDNTRDIITHHLSSFQENNLDAVVSDYTNESVLITQDATYKGPEEIRAFFVGLMRNFPKQKSSFELDKLVVNGDLAYIVWHARTPNLHVPLGSDTFIIKDGKIYQQTFVGQLNYFN